MKRTIVYIDGFNLYHAIDDLKRPHLKWVDLWALSQSLLRSDEMLTAVKYFSAYATWMPDRHARHRAYTAALQSAGVELNMSQFKAKPRRCFKCKATWVGHEEKETNVLIAVKMVSDALTGQADRIILITADTDLGPAIQTIATHAPECEVFVATPPGRLASCRSLKPKLEITKGRISKALLPAKIDFADGTSILRPAIYSPPS